MKQYRVTLMQMIQR